MNRPYNEFETRQQIKVYAHTLDAGSYILRALGFPIHKLRDVVDGLQGAAGGREQFELSHRALARRLRHNGDDRAAETYAARKVAALDREQRKTGRMLFTIERGGGFEHKRTQYIDHLTPVANWMMQQARASDLWATHPGKAIEAFTTAAIEMLPRAPSAETEAEKNPIQIEDDLYIQRMINQGINCTLKACERAASIGRNDADVAEMAIEKLRRYLRNQHDARTNGGEAHSDGEPPQICGGSDEKASKNEPLSVDMGAAALAYAHAGKPVFPTRADKTPLTANGFKDATTDERTIRAWWARWRDAGIGIPTGKASGLLTVDIDPRHGGDCSLTELIEAHGQLPETMEVRTGGGGHHIIFAYPQGAEIRNSAGKLGEGIDVRGEGGYNVAPPSLHASGRRYERLNDAAPAPLPEWLLKLLTEEKRKVASLAAQTHAQAKSSATAGDVIAEGNRNHMLFKIGSSMRGKGASYEDIEAELLDINARRCTPALPVDEVIKIARSVMRYAPNCATVGA